MEEGRTANASGEVLNGNPDNTGQDQGGDISPKQYSEEEYKNAQAFGAKANQELINANIELAKLNPEKILSFDKSMQDKIVNDIYGLSDVEELKTIHGDNFWDKSSEKPNDLDKMKREIDLLNLKNSKGDIDREVLSIKNNNPKYFEDENAEVLLREKLEIISKDLSPSERVGNAFKVAFGGKPTSNESGYKQASVGSQGSAINADASKGVNEQQDDIIKSNLAFMKGRRS